MKEHRPPPPHPPPAQGGGLPVFGEFPPPASPQPQAGPLPTYGGDRHYGQPTGYYSGQDARAGMGKRALARLLDYALICLLAVPVAALLTGGETPTQPGQLWVFQACIGAVALMYDLVMLMVRGATLGMMLLKIRVCNEATGEKLNVAASMVRAVCVHGWWLINLGLASALIYLSPFLDSSGRRQGWHDKLARDVVINDEPA